MIIRLMLVSFLEVEIEVLNVFIGLCNKGRHMMQTTSIFITDSWMCSYTSSGLFLWLESVHGISFSILALYCLLKHKKELYN